MAYLKNYGKRFGFTFLGIFITLIVLTTFYYFDLIGDSLFSFLELFTLTINIFVNSFILGKSASKNGYIEGAKFGGAIVFILLIITLIFSKFRFSVLIYYLIIITTSILGSMIGISKKRD